MLSFQDYLNYVLQRLIDSHTVVLGKTRTGKTTMFKIILEYLISKYKDSKFFVYNTQKQKDIRKLGNVVTDFNTFRQCFSKNQVTVFEPKLRFGENTSFNDLSKMIQHIFLVQDYHITKDKEKNVIVVIDEIDQFIPKHNQGLVPEITMILRTGIAYKIRLVGITHVIQETHNQLFRHSDNALIFSLNNYDWDFTRKYFPELPNERIKEKYESIFIDKYEDYTDSNFVRFVSKKSVSGKYQLQVKTKRLKKEENDNKEELKDIKFF